jgi:hypothetical protein
VLLVFLLLLLLLLLVVLVLVELALLVLVEPLGWTLALIPTCPSQSHLS